MATLHVLTDPGDPTSPFTVEDANAGNQIARQPLPSFEGQWDALFETLSSRQMPEGEIRAHTAWQ